jgi:cysteine desulfurase
VSLSLRLPIYLDHNATTPVDARVFEAMTPYFCGTFGNAASTGHPFGWSAKAAVEKARRQAAAILGAAPGCIVWTSGATEANNLAIKGVAAARRDKGRHIITQATEHKAVLDPCKRLKEQGFDVTVLPVDSRGQIDLDELASSLRPDTILVSIMWANNEIGTIQSVGRIGELCRAGGVLFHTDATQAVGRIPVDVERNCIDLLSFSGHKFYGPKGCGALYVRHDPCVELSPLFDGGGHECGFRSGTLNVPGIVGVGMACEVAMEVMEAESRRLGALRDKLETGIVARLSGVHVNGDPVARMSHVTNLSFEGLCGDSLVGAFEDIAVSSGSACTSACPEPSHVLRACGLSPELAKASLRFSLGRSTTGEEIDYVISKTVECVTNLRALAGMSNRKVEVWVNPDMPSPPSKSHLAV